MRKRLLSVLLAFMMVVTILPAMSKTVDAETYSGQVNASDLVAGDILESGASIEAQGLTVILQSGGSCIKIGETYQQNSGTINIGGQAVIEISSEGVITVNSMSLYPYANGKVDKWKVVSVGEDAITLAGYAPEPVSYLDADGNEQTCTKYTVVSSSDSSTVWNDGWYVVKGNVTSRGIYVNSGTVNLILCDGAKLDVGPLRLTGGNLTIYAQSAGNNMGSLKVEADGDNDCGIDTNESSLTIVGGNITAIGPAGAISGSVKNAISGTGWKNTEGTGDFTPISVKTEGQSISSDIKKVQFPTLYPLWVGGTRVTSANASNITGGETVTASYTPADTTTDPVTPAKLTLNNYSYEGTGYNSDAIHSEENLIIETSGTNNVANTSSASGTRAIGVDGDLTLQGSGTLNATGGRRSIVANTVTVERGTVTVSGGRYGIYASSGENGNITINGGEVNASGSEYGLQAANDVIIKNGTVIAIATETDNNNVAIFADKNITIEGGNVEATGLVGILAYEKLMIEDGIIRATGISAGIGGLITVTINNGTIVATATDDSGAYGIFGNGVTINDGQVTASGSTAGISGFVKNAIAGTGWSDTEGTEGKADISVSSQGQDLSEYKKVQFPTAHTHDFTYTASGDTITATCSAEGCPLPPSTTGGSDHVATLTIAAPLHTTYGDGNDAAAQITDANSIKGAAKVQYQKKTGESTYDTATETAPTNAGTYKASITLGTGDNSATAHVVYTIAQKPVTVSGITAENKEYDGNTAAALNFESAAISGKADVDAVELSTTEATGAFSDKKAENGKTVTISGLALTGADASNYVLSSQPTTTANITIKEVTVTGITASNKEYDGKTNATVNCGSAVINGKVENDDLTFNAPTGSFSDKTVGDGKTVSFSGLALSGADAANYSLSAQPADTTANITAKPVTITGVTAEDKVYDGNRTATAKTAEAVIDGKVDSDELSINPGTGSFSDKNVGNNKTVSFSGFALTGNDSANYTLSAQPADTTAAITAKPVTVSGITASDKIYDGTTDATLDYTSASFDGRVGDDNLTVTATGAFADANAGQDKTVNITGLTLGGTDKANYVLAAEGQQTTDQADIAQKSITGATVTLDKTQLTYNGQEQSVSVTGVTTSDGMTLTANDYEVASGTNKGTDKGNYQVTVTGKGNFKDTATADWKIVEKAMTVKADNVTVTYDGKEHGIKVEVIDPASGAEVKYGTTEGRYDLDESPTIKEPGTLTVYYRVTAGSNYSVYTGKAVVTVNKPAEIISAEQAVVKGVSKGKTSLKFTWNKVDKAASYEVWMAKCGKKMKKVKTLGASKTSWTKKKLKRRTAYKFYVVAKDSSGNVISRSLTGHAITGNVRGRYTNAKSLSVSQSSINLNKGGTAKISATQKKAKKGKKLCKHAALLRYTSNNLAVATVDSNGTVTGVGAGSCVVYVQTVNGIWQTVTVNVN